MKDHKAPERSNQPDAQADPRPRPPITLLLEHLWSGLADEIRQVVRKEVREALATSPPPSEMPGPPVLAVTVAEAAQRLSVAEHTVRDWIKSGHLRATRTPGGRVYLVRVADLEAFLNASPQANSNLPDVDEQVARLVRTTSKRKD